MDHTLRGRATPSEPTARWSVGGLFIEALASLDFEAMAACTNGEEA